MKRRPGRRLIWSLVAATQAVRHPAHHPFLPNGAADHIDARDAHSDTDYGRETGKRVDGDPSSDEHRTEQPLPDSGRNWPPIAIVLGTGLARWGRRHDTDCRWRKPSRRHQTRSRFGRWFEFVAHITELFQKTRPRP